MNTRTQDKALEAYKLWLSNRLPEQVDVITMPAKAIAFGYVYIDVSPKIDMVLYNPEPPVSYNRPVTAKVEMIAWYDKWTCKNAWLGWHDNPATLIVCS